MLFFISLAFLFFNFTGRETEKQRRRETGSREAAGKRRQSAGLVCPGRAGLLLCSRSGRPAGAYQARGLSVVRLLACQACALLLLLPALLSASPPGLSFPVFSLPLLVLSVPLALLVPLAGAGGGVGGGAVSCYILFLYFSLYLYFIQGFAASFAMACCVFRRGGCCAGLLCASRAPEPKQKNK